MRWSKEPKTMSVLPSPSTSPSAGELKTAVLPVPYCLFDWKTHVVAPPALITATPPALGDTSTSPKPTTTSFCPSPVTSPSAGLDAIAAPTLRSQRVDPLALTAYTVPLRPPTTTSFVPSWLTSAIAGDDQWNQAPGMSFRQRVVSAADTGDGATSTTEAASAAATVTRARMRRAMPDKVLG